MTAEAAGDASPTEVLEKAEAEPEGTLNNLFAELFGENRFDNLSEERGAEPDTALDTLFDNLSKLKGDAAELLFSPSPILKSLILFFNDDISCCIYYTYIKFRMPGATQRTI